MMVVTPLPLISANFLAMACTEINCQSLVLNYIKSNCISLNSRFLLRFNELFISTCMLIEPSKQKVQGFNFKNFNRVSP
jgi:hypothetical protein